MLYRLLFLTAALMVLSVTPALSDPLRIVTLEQVPYGYMEDGSPTGLLYDIGNAIAEEAGLAAENRFVNLERGIEEIIAGRADIIIIFPNPRIRAVAKNLGSILHLETVILGSAGSDFSSIGDLAGKSVASLRGAQYDARLSHIESITVLPIKDYIYGLKMVANKRADAIVGPIYGLEHSMKANGLSRALFGTPLVLHELHANVYYSIHGDAERASKVRAAIACLKQDGVVDALLAKYALEH
ncbi:substrate-binding periplasmic protein [Pseudodesulfovibrio sediminis]|uniref:Solute-binding protein family 3/N-terminal domain-containing protein n=1 Tax=Pseudodesulfovibrio sediminis TaxID=2810563 RepID=A0ABM8HYA5_9BACT|nr:transporter substrate-binding domain-containing protein [Pseudodesulfovibrio sediminis]BCS89427.1 hypothetical protein PSDVSF_26690 [Pseudodesulfovibrio sediminis]